MPSQPMTAQTCAFKPMQINTKTLKLQRTLDAMTCALPIHSSFLGITIFYTNNQLEFFFFPKRVTCHKSSIFSVIFRPLLLSFICLRLSPCDPAIPDTLLITFMGHHLQPGSPRQVLPEVRNSVNSHDSMSQNTSK